MRVESEILDGLQKSTSLPQQAPDKQLLRRGLIANTRLIMPASRGTCFPMIPQERTAMEGMRLQPMEYNLDAAALCRQRGLNLALGQTGDCAHSR